MDKTPRLVPPTAIPSVQGTRDPDVVPLHSARDADREFDAICAVFQGKETEDNWEKREQTLQRLRGVLKGIGTWKDDDDGDKINEAVVLGVRKILDAALGATLSLRTALVVTACSALQDIATSFRTNLDSSADPMLTTLLKLISQTKKLVHTSGASTITALLRSCNLKPRLLDKLAVCVEDKNLQVRQYGMAFVSTVLEKQLESASAEQIPKASLDLIEKAIKKGVADANAQVREYSRGAFVMYSDLWPARADALLQTFDAQTKRTLSRAATKQPSRPSVRPRPPSAAEAAPSSPRPKSTGSTRPALATAQRSTSSSAASSPGGSPRPLSGPVSAAASPARRSTVKRASTGSINDTKRTSTPASRTLSPAVFEEDERLLQDAADVSHIDDNESITEQLLDEYDASLEEQNEERAVHYLHCMVDHLRASVLSTLSSNDAEPFSPRVVETVANALRCECVPLIREIIMEPTLVWSVFDTLDDDNQRGVVNGLVRLVARISDEHGLAEMYNPTYVRECSDLTAQCVDYAASAGQIMPVVTCGMEAAADEPHADDRAAAASVLRHWHVHYCCDLADPTRLTSDTRNWLSLPSNLHKYISACARLIESLSAADAEHHQLTNDAGILSQLQLVLSQVCLAFPEHARECADGLVADGGLAEIVHGVLALSVNSSSAKDDVAVEEDEKSLSEELGTHLVDGAVPEPQQVTHPDRSLTTTPAPDMMTQPILPPVHIEPETVQDQQIRVSSSPVRSYSDGKLPLPIPISAVDRLRSASLPTDDTYNGRRRSSSSYSGNPEDAKRYLEVTLGAMQSGGTVTSLDVYKITKLARQASTLHDVADKSSEHVAHALSVWTPALCTAMIEEDADVREDCVLFLRTAAETLSDLISEELFANMADALLLLRNDRVLPISMVAEETIDQLLELYNAELLYPSVWTAVGSRWLEAGEHHALGNGDAPGGQTDHSSYPQHHDSVGLSVYNKVLRHFDSDRLVQEEDKLSRVVQKGLHDQRGITRKCTVSLLITFHSTCGNAAMDRLAQLSNLTPAHRNLIQRYIDKTVSRSGSGETLPH
ncbi:suppressor of tub2 mutation [Sorochytrium milnesiophthora]